MSTYFCKFPPGNPKNRTSASFSAFLLDTAAPNAGLLSRFTGTTSSESNTVLVFSQELEAGTEVPAGTVITVRLGDTTVRD